VVETLTVLFAGGGTGGHLFPALALAEEIKRRIPAAEITFVGTSRGIETQVLPAQGYKLVRIWIRGFKRRLSLGNLIFPLMLITSLIQSLALIIKSKPDVVIGTGGYVSGPVVLMAALLGVPTLIQEQNSYPGFSTRLLSRWVDRVHLSFEESRRYFKHQNKLRVSGNPTRSELRSIPREEALKKFNLSPDRITLLVFGGSQGATRINQALLGILDKLMRGEKLQLIWATGQKDFEEVKAACRRYGERVYVRPFIDDMASAYAACDLALCRSGATTVAELTRCGVPALLVPYPYAAAGHQEYNARTLAAKGAAVMILDRDLGTKRFENTLMGLLGDDQKRERMRIKSSELGKPEAAKRVVDDVLELCSSK